MATASALIALAGKPNISNVGITEVYTPNSEVDTLADLVFVHGLMGHPKRTWLYGSEATENESAKSSRKWLPFKKSTSTQQAAQSVRPHDKAESCYWPFDLLPKALPDVRVLVYGYDSHPTHFYKTRTTRMTITQHANDLMHKVASIRSECLGRPLIFVAHSLGGILVKGALNESRLMAQQPRYMDLYQSCRAIMFMGTPHLGANIASWGEIMSNIVGALPGGFSTHSGLLKGLEPDSETLYVISRRFNEILNSPIETHEKIQICSVQEGQGMTSVKGLGSKVPSTQYSRSSADKMKVVPDQSSTFNRTDIEQSFFNQTANHMDMCKFYSADDQAYKDVLSVLKGYCKIVQARKTTQGRMKEAAQTSLVSALLERFNFDSRLVRERQLNRLSTIEQSFDWIRESPFVQWLQSDEKLFWIAGHPASGKSTMVNYMANHERTANVMRQVSGAPKDVKIIKFFFDYRGKAGITNNFEGLRKSLVYQLLELSDQLSLDVGKVFGLHQGNAQVMLDDERLLASVLDYILQNIDSSLLLFLDGLDEYEGDKPDLLRLIDQLTGFEIKICLSSRFEKPFSVTYKDLRNQLRMDKVNILGIGAYARATLQTSLRPSSHNESAALESSASAVAHASNGVFLWARFAVLELIDAMCDGRDIEEEWMQQIVRSMPPQLEDVYERLLRKLKPKDKHAYGTILRLITASERALEISELFEASQIAGIEFQSSQYAVDSDDLLRFQRYIEAIGGGVVETIPITTQKIDDDAHRQVTLVRIIHRSVQAFLDKAGWVELLGKHAAGESHHQAWLNICTSYLGGKHRVRWDPLQVTRTPDFSGWNPYAISWRRKDNNTPAQTSDDEYEEDDDSLSEGSRPAAARRRSQVQLRVQDLDHYVHSFLPHYAFHFEQETQTSSWSLIHAALTHAFIDKHVKAYLDCDGYECCFAGMSQMQWPLVLSSDVHLAIAHRLIYYVKECLQRDPSIADTQDTASVSLWSLKRKPFSGFPSSSEVRTSAKSASLLQTAMLCCSKQQYVNGSEILQHLSIHSPRLNDDDMLMAIRSATRAEIEALIASFPTGPLSLHSKLLFHDVSLFSWDCELESAHEFGPLWEIGGREDVETAAEVLKLLLDRGEDINAQCGPEGTILHAALINSLQSGGRGHGSHDKLKPMLDMLLEHGADIEAEGPEGNVLEFMWKYAHCVPYRWGALRYGPLIRLLIESGGTNSRQDPNGLVPDKDHMLKIEDGPISMSWHLHPYEHGGWPSDDDVEDADEVDEDMELGANMVDGGLDADEGRDGPWPEKAPAETERQDSNATLPVQAKNREARPLHRQLSE